MPQLPLSARVIIDLAVREREPGDEALDTVQWQMPTTVLQAFAREAGRRGTDVNSVLRDVVCTALTERADAIRRHHQDTTAERVPLQLVRAEPGPPPTSTPVAVAVPHADVPLDAQELMYQAWEAPTRAAARRLAQQALALWPDCADAYNVLAQQARSRTEQRRLYSLGLGAGERALGPDSFERHRGHFWGLLESRPYMRARQGLAHALAELDERPGAIAHAWAMLDLNPMDNQGMRYPLASWLLAECDAAELDRLFALFPDEWSAALAYPKALHRFRQEGPSRPTTKALRFALRVNAFVPAYLLGEQPLPKTLPTYIGMGDEREAAAYAVEAKALWEATEGATAWLAAAVRKRTQQRRR